MPTSVNCQLLLIPTSLTAQLGWLDKNGQVDAFRVAENDQGINFENMSWSCSWCVI